MRFGNKAFRSWLDKLISTARQHLVTFSSLPGYESAIPELEVYLVESFGHYERLDYGTGHELSFFAFLFCLFKIGVLLQEDLKPTINCVFQKYLLLMRIIQEKYCLEPAGSHGVWGLDDYQHLAFLMGASQLQRSGSYLPESIHEEQALRDRDNYMYFGCI
jgi:serine/threonine-protein phosphatase 2A activator